MKKPGFGKTMKASRILLTTALVLIFVVTACRKDDNDINIINNQPDLEIPEHHGIALFLYKRGSTALNSASYRVYDAEASLGNEICSGGNLTNWHRVSSVQSQGNQYLVSHPNSPPGGLYGKEFEIRKIYPGGYVGGVTQSQTWNNNYETFFGFQLGNRGFIFGLDAGLNHNIWFTQEVYPDGTLAQDEAASGEWNNYYENATPLYSNGQTYLFFQNDNSHYWFISHVSDDGSLHDVCDGTWGYNWKVLTSAEVEDNTYIIGETSSENGWFIQRINYDGTMGDETDRSAWSQFYNCQVAYTLGEQIHLFGCSGNSNMPNHYFIQDITLQGKMGAETSTGSIDPPDIVVPLKLYEKPGSFRYVIGWNMAQTTGNPTGWSSRHDDAWGGYFKMGGGAALANIDGDASKIQDALLMGIEDQHGADRFYYKIAWNLDIFGNPTSMSNTMFGPTIGESQAGAGADIIDIDSNQDPDLIFMVVDDPEGPNAFWYYIGYNVNHQGVPTNWSNKIQVPGLGDFNQGGGAAAGLIDNNLRPDLVFIGIDNPWEDNTIWMVVGKNINWFGVAESWTPKITLPCDIGWNSAGGGAALADINNNGHPDLVLMNIDNPHGPNNLWSWVGWDIDINGNVASWSQISSPPSPGNITSGGGTAIGDIDLNGTPDLFLMTIDNPAGND